MDGGAALATPIREAAPVPYMQRDVDALSELLRVVKLTGAMFFHAEFSAPWGVNSSPARLLQPLLAPNGERLIIYHFLAAGRAQVKHGDSPAVCLRPGDIVVFPHGDRHLLSNGVPRCWMDSASDLPALLSRRIKLARAGGGGEITRFVCGYFRCDVRLSHGFLSGLPPVLVVNVRDEGGGAWLESSILHAVTQLEQATPGSEVIVAKLSEVLFAETLRRYMTTLPREQTGWLAGARDAAVGRALAALHAAPAYPWTIDALARKAGLSRSALTARFKHYLGVAPMAYLTDWRLRLGAEALGATKLGVTAVAGDVGYESEAAFNRAFKRKYGVPPARFRRERALPCTVRQSLQ
ncbi:MAG TPA: AraC family transcriptional regulator [Burkholderiaceae bacterium]|nr:AraC family transcriptional regulator [Burkholderiaceae bacterium]